MSDLKVKYLAAGTHDDISQFQGRIPNLGQTRGVVAHLLPDLEMRSTLAHSHSFVEHQDKSQEPVHKFIIAT